MTTRSQAAADELAALLRRHKLKRAIDLIPLAKKKGIDLDAATLWRIVKAKAKTEPKAETLRDIAAAVGETRVQAFPSSTDGAERGVGIEADPYWTELRTLAQQMAPTDRARLLERAQMLAEGAASPPISAIAMPATGGRPAGGELSQDDLLAAADLVRQQLEEEAAKKAPRSKPKRASKPQK